nr:hypothetical protein [Tanacetum cinerariifolium]
MAYVECQLPKVQRRVQTGQSLGKSDENDVDMLKRAQSIYRDEHKGVAFCQEDAWAILKFHPKWDAPEQVDLTGDVPGDTQEDLFGHDARPRPASKPRPPRKPNLTPRAAILDLQTLAGTTYYFITDDVSHGVVVDLGIHGLGLVIVAIEKKLVVVLVDLGIHGLGLVIVAIGKKLVVILVGVVETVPASSTRIG